jgi:hypothetical protein
MIYLMVALPFCQINSMFFELYLKNVELIWQKGETYESKFLEARNDVKNIISGF